MVTLHQDTAAKVSDGITSMEEALSNVPPDMEDLSSSHLDSEQADAGYRDTQEESPEEFPDAVTVGALLTVDASSDQRFALIQSADLSRCQGPLRGVKFHNRFRFANRCKRARAQGIAIPGAGVNTAPFGQSSINEIDML